MTIWDKKQSEIRLYVNGAVFNGTPFIKLNNGSPVVFGSMAHEKEEIISAFPEIFSRDLMTNKELKDDGSRSKSGRRSPFSPKTKNDFSLSTIIDYRENSESIDLKKCQFKASSLSGFDVLVDSREPQSIFDLFLSTEIPSVNIATLPVGDIIIGDKESGNKIIIERKTVSDFSQSITSSHAHDQAERLFEYQQSEISDGHDVKVFWLIESSEDGKGMYSALPQVKQMSGMVGYLSGIHDHHVLECYSKRYLVYLCLKLFQNHIDKELINKVQSTNGNRGFFERKNISEKRLFKSRCQYWL